ncbi:nad dependent epimerase dehydratase family protein [Colletotrichum kahawae]|uniref:Nad dependent epimerase dehydratase family protein n=1 Tax=Colletotrichum kahawae TaxID=34407 RepID=A0AAD9YXF1_COLKA|nr:nad dependent epimerase dehydratase family protein [Colletotrichum kahawae]
MSTSLIFITRATGFIGSQIASSVLKAGYRVRLSVRREEQIQKLREAFPTFADQIQFILVPDFTKTNAFADAVVGVDYVIHVASPMVGQGNDFQKDYINPAVQGTLSVLDAAKATPSIKRVLITSSILALLPLEALFSMARDGLVVRERAGIDLPVDVNMEFPEGLEGHTMKYHGSKTLAHQATEDWVKKNKPFFKVLTLHPSFVTGPSLLQKKAEEVDSINRLFLDAVRTGTIAFPPVLVDVRDVAEGFYRALTALVPADFQEFVLSGVTTSWNEIAEFVQKLYPTADYKLKPPVEGAPTMSAVTKAADEILGMKWKPLEELIRGVVDVQLAFKA